MKAFIESKKRELVTLVAIVVIYAFFSILDPSYLKWNNFCLILQQATINGVIAIGMTFAIMTGGIDLSVGAVYGSVVVAIAFMTVGGWHPVLSIFGGLGLGILSGLLNGFLITKMKLQPFIATLGTVRIFRGVAYVVTNGIPITGVPNTYRVIFNMKLAKGIYVNMIVFLALAIIMGIVLGKTKFGSYLYAIGGNEEAAKLAGLNVNLIKIGAYTICAICASIAGMICLSNLGSGNPTAGDGYELDAIAACAIGGSKMSGGKGSILGTFLGAILLAALRVGMIILNINTFYQYIMTGSVIVIAAFFEVIQERLEYKAQTSATN